MSQINKQLEVSTATDAELVARAQDGDDAAFAALVSRYISFVYNLSLRYMRDREEADDATQMVFVKVWRVLERVDIGKPLRPLIGEITKNTCLDVLKKKRAIPFSAFDTADDDNILSQTLESNDPSPCEQAALNARAGIAAAALRILSESSRRVLSLYYFEGFNFREIGELLGAPVHTIKSRHRRALQQLRRHIGAI